MGKAVQNNGRLQYPSHPFTLSVDEVVQRLQVNLDTGLSVAKAQELRAQYGDNKLSGEGGVSWYRVLLKQISNAMILVSDTLPRQI